jgi:hypothetical protein
VTENHGGRNPKADFDAPHEGHWDWASTAAAVAQAESATDATAPTPLIFRDHRISIAVEPPR